MVQGIYKITNNRTGEVYIGQSSNMTSRKKTHFEQLAQGKHPNLGMQNDYSSGDTFSFEIILEMPNATQTQLCNHENYYIGVYNSFLEGYNQTPGGDMDRYEGKYKYGGGRLPVEKYRDNIKYLPTDIDRDNMDLPPTINKYWFQTLKQYDDDEYYNNEIKRLCQEIKKGKSMVRNGKIMLTVSIILAVIIYYSSVIFALIIPLIIAIYSFFKLSQGKFYINQYTEFKNSTEEWKKEWEDLKKEQNKTIEYNDKINTLKKKLNEKSLFVEDSIIKTVDKLSINEKKEFCDVYDIKNTNEDILEFIAKNWVGYPYLQKKPFFKIDHVRANTVELKNMLSDFKTNKKSIPRPLIHKVLIRDEYTCQKCGKDLSNYLILDKLLSNGYVQLIKPLEGGGTITEDNLITICKESCESHLIPYKDIIEIYKTINILESFENHFSNLSLDLSRIERNGLSLKFPSYYSVDNIPINCPKCIISLTKDDGKCDIIIEMGELQHDFNSYNKFSELKYYLGENGEHINKIDNFSDIQPIVLPEIKTYNKINYNPNKYKNYFSEIEEKYCFIGMNNYEGKKYDENVKSIIYFDYNHTDPIKITLNSLLEDKYNCMNDLLIIATSLRTSK